MTVFTLAGLLQIWVILKGFLLMQLFSVLFLRFHSCFCPDGRSSVVEKCLFMPQRLSLFWFRIFLFLKFRQFSPRDFVFVFGMALMGFTYGPLGNFFIGIISY
jgi:hypothetical protein